MADLTNHTFRTWASLYRPGQDSLYFESTSITMAMKTALQFAIDFASDSIPYLTVTVLQIEQMAALRITDTATKDPTEFAHGITLDDLHFIASEKAK